MHSCHLARKLWEKVSFRCQKEGRIHRDIIAIVCNWDQNPYQSRILNFLWKLILGFLMWTIWKERNRRIFKDDSVPLENIWKIIYQNIKETLLLHTWYEEDFPSLPQEQNIWSNWNLQWNQEPISKGTTPPKGSSPEKWLPPPKHMIQLNFDGASKGNPGNVGFQGIFRDYKGAPLLTFLGSKGWDTNNSAGLEGLWQGLILAQNKGYFSLIIEGNSQIIINMVIKIMQGTSSSKVSNSWRMAKRLELIKIWLFSHRAITLKHIRWEGNKVADLLANIGVESGLDLHIGSISRLAFEIQLMEYQNIVKKEMKQGGEEHGDAGETRTH